MHVVPAALTVALSISLAVSPALGRVEGFDTSAFGKSPGVTKQQKIVLQIEDESEVKDGPGDKNAPVDIPSLDLRIKSYTTILKSARNEEERAKFLISRAVLYLAKGRAYASGKAKAEEDLSLENSDDDENAEGGKSVVAAAAQIAEKTKAMKLEVAELTAAFNSASLDAEGAGRVNALEKKMRVYAHYLAALGYIGLEQRDKAASILERALRDMPDASYSAGIILYLADYYYEKEHYDKAVALLEKYAATLRPREAALARYKMAWCYTALQRLPLAEKMFIALVKDPKAGEASRDAVKELAYVSTQTRDEENVVKLSDELFGSDPEKKSEFLSSAWSNLQRMDSAKQSSVVFNGLMQMATGPEKRIQLWLEEIRANRHAYASARHIAGLKAIRQELSQLPVDKMRSIVKATGEEILIELEQLIRTYGDTYAKRERNHDHLPQMSIVRDLRDLFATHIGFFPEAANRGLVYRLWLDLDNDEKNYESVHRVATSILKEPAMKALFPQATNDNIYALDNLGRKSPAAWKPKLVAALEEYTREQAAPKWTEFARLLADEYVKQNQFAKALPLLDILNTRLPTSNSFHRLQMARFMTGKFREVINAKPPYGIEMNGPLNDVVREASLKLASENKGEGGNFQDFESNVQRFLSLNRDESKELIVLGDYVKKLLEREELDRAFAKLLELGFEKRATKELAPLTSQTALRLMRRGDFAQAAKFFGPTDDDEAGRFAYERTLARLGSGANVSAEDFDRLKPEKREYLLGILALTAPTSALQYLESRESLDARLKKIGYLALQIQFKRSKPKLPAHYRELLELASAGGPPSRAEQAAASIQFPSARIGAEKAAALMEKVVTRVREVRRLVTPSLQGRTPEAQSRILSLAARLEERTASAIEKSKPPKGLSKLQRTVYGQALAKVAIEFREQAADFQKAQANLEKLASREDAKPEPNRLPAGTMGFWPWPQTPARTATDKLVKAGNLTGAIMMIDLKRASAEINEAEYYALRGGTLITFKQNDAMEVFVYQELKAAKQSKLLENWETITL